MLPAPFQHSLVLTGPTGSGKTRLGVELAEKLGAEIISMDSMALYRRMEIGTAKPTAAERARVRHHLVDELETWESASVAWWLERAEACSHDIELRGKRVLFVGGTPLYLKALMFGLFEGPRSDLALRKRLQEEAERTGPEALHQRLAAVDPVTAERLHPNDVRRVVRALEIWEGTGSRLSELQTQWSDSLPAAVGKAASFAEPAGKAGSIACGASILWLDLPREELYRRINARVLAMFDAGLVDEVRSLLELPRPISREAGQALGYKEVFAYLDGQATLDQTIERVQTRTRNFAKRQITWFRHLPGCLPTTEQLTWKLWEAKIKKENPKS
jgi:tRNA dimethylallyltransferase